jgi:predicted CXXCH cytochrome family protein
MRRTALFLTLVVALPAGLGAQRSILDSRHNLSASGPGPLRAVAETRVCVFCHTPHQASPQAPLWNREDPGGTFEMYWSDTLDAYPSAAGAPQPNGASKLCLSCHDGTLALGSTVASGQIAMSGASTLPSSSASHIGRVLTGDHPVSFVVNDSLVSENNNKGDVPLRSVAEMRIARGGLDDRDRVQCTSCHDPHDDAYGDFLLTPLAGELCLGCHY